MRAQTIACKLTPRTPAKSQLVTISRKLLRDLRRVELGFEGLIAAASISMVGLTSRTRPEERAVLRIEAAVDVYFNTILDYRPGGRSNAQRRSRCYAW